MWSEALRVSVDDRSIYAVIRQPSGKNTSSLLSSFFSSQWREVDASARSQYLYWKHPVHFWHTHLPPRIFSLTGKVYKAACHEKQNQLLDKRYQMSCCCYYKLLMEVLKCFLKRAGWRDVFGSRVKRILSYRPKYTHKHSTRGPSSGSKFVLCCMVETVVEKKYLWMERASREEPGARTWALSRWSSWTKRWYSPRRVLPYGRAILL